MVSFVPGDAFACFTQKYLSYALLFFVKQVFVYINATLIVTLCCALFVKSVNFLLRAAANVKECDATAVATCFTAGPQKKTLTYSRFKLFKFWLPGQ